MAGGVQVFISHTSDMAGYPDRNVSFVRAAIDAVNRARHVPVDMAYFAARDGQPARYCHEQVLACSVYVAVVGFRYGSIVPDTSMSYTELEFQAATEAGLPRLVFLLNERPDLPAGLVDADRSRIDRFRARLGDAGLILRNFSTVDRLEFEVFHALTELNPPSSGGPARDTLPARQAVFVGRDRELEQITAAVTDATVTSGVVAIHAIDGMPGIGKTALAVRAAHLLTATFPDRRLFVDLHGYTPGHEPTDPADALADLLRADGLDPRQLPDGLQARSALWRDRMNGKSTLLVLDNARSTAQVRPLLPGTSNALVLITSRARLADLPEATHLNLQLLCPADAAAMFLRLVPRAEAEPEAVAELVEVCGFLPLAIAITASRFATRPTWTMADLLAKLYGTGGRVLTVKGEEATVRAAFDLSYRHLPPERQRFFRLLCLHPGIDIDDCAAAALTNTTLDGAIEHLDRLYGDHLLDEPAPGRYRMHDLVRTFGCTLASTIDPPPVRDEAVARLLDYYQHTAGRADRLIARYTRSATTTVVAPAAAPQLTGWDSAAGWLRVERANLLACLHHTTARDQHHRVVGLTAGLTNLLRSEGPWTTAVDLHQHAINHAAQVGDRLSQANALHDLGAVRRLIGDYPGAENVLSQALDLHRALDNHLGQANTLIDLGAIRALTGDNLGAENALIQALHLHRALDNHLGQANTLHRLGVVRWLIGDYPGADDLLNQALDLHRALNNQLGQAHVLHELGAVRRLAGDYPGANDLLGQALGLHRALDHRHGQANTLHELGVVRRSIGDHPNAEKLLHQALDLHRAFDNRLGQAHVLQDLGIVRRLTRDYPSAEKLLHQALDLHRTLNNRLGQAYTRTQLAVVRYLTGDHAAAEDLLQQALTTLRKVRAPDDEAEALNHLGTLRRLTGHPDQAHALHQEALTISHHHGHRIEEARAHEGIGRAATDLGNMASAVSHLRQALRLYLALGIPEATQVTVDLATLDPATEVAGNRNP
ncbi:tetratricopeptide repeat protein [Plantactinospora sp. KLBMP9567]|uniref:tetratricopeptide repeat protein n=1 Tax=Plantactinospora sp. KLBMP9567 TaxID=3085900 RepID=UPI0029816D42|nr:tetratricopeptide repeat protein [Plantactinospora sp. KLBMP9567]MDW5326765.1 tetratricopeptide repeat protein [Plantactinospora sp. KLBMP9567]